MPRKQKEPRTRAMMRTTLTLPEDLWERVKTIGKQTNPQIPANEVAVRLLEHAINEYQLVISVDIRKLPK